MANSTEAIKSVLQSTIGRVVAGLTSVLLLPFMPSIVDGFNSLTGIGLNDQEVIEFAKAAAVGAALVVSTWLFNRGRFEATALAVKDAYDRGHESLASQKLPPTAGGSTHVGADY